MSLGLKHVSYGSLKTKQRESFNFQKVSGVLADYGFSTIRLTQDWQGADFIAQHVDGKTFLPVQLKGRLALRKSYMGKGLWMCFRDGNDAYLFPHDAVLDLVIASGKAMEQTESWNTNGRYSWPTLPKWIKPLLQNYRLQPK